MANSGPDEGSRTGATPARRRRWAPPSYVGLIGALVAVSLAQTPSLLPRPWLLGGLVAGVAAALGYALGVLISAAVRLLLPREPGVGVRRAAWWALAVGGLVLVVTALWLGGRAQDEVRRLVGEPATDVLYELGTGLVCLGTFLFLLWIARAIRGLTRRGRARLGRHMPQRVAAVLAVTGVAVVGVGILGGIGFGSMAVIDRIYAARNAETQEGVTQPTASARSGSPDSLVPWDSLGLEGRSFIGRGPTVEQIESFTGRPALDPIRVFVGVETAPTAQDRARRVLAELERTGAFDRAVLVLAGTAGTGWVEAQTMDALEYMWGGDSAIAALQYS